MLEQFFAKEPIEIFFKVLEIIAMVIGFLYVFFEIRKSRKMWYFMLYASVLNIFVYFHSRYFSMVLIQFYYIIASLYGLRQWGKIKHAAGDQLKSDDDSKKVAIKHIEKKKALISTAVAVAAYFVLAPLFNHLASGDFIFNGQPYFDTAIAVLSMLATYWLSQSYKEQWYIWIFVNAVSVPIFIAGKIYFMAALYVAYLVMAIIGIREWKRNGVYIDQI